MSTTSTDQFESPESSSVVRARYYSKSKRLEVTFTHGGMYTYEGVNPALWKRFKASPSKGAFLNTYIRGNQKLSTSKV